MTDDLLKFFVPTSNSANILQEIFYSCLNQNNEKAYILSGPYGAGKSIFTLVLTAVLTRPSYVQRGLDGFFERLLNLYPEIKEDLDQFISAKKRYLPVVLSGNEGSLDVALVRGLMQSLRKHDVTGINPPTIYNAVKNKVKEWEKEYPDVFSDFKAMLAENRIGIDQFLSKMDQCDNEYYAIFLKTFPKVTGGSDFNPMFDQSPINIYKEVAHELTRHGYDGIFVIYDEFGRFLESRIGKPLEAEAQLLQDFAEFCNTSGVETSTKLPVHFIGITHRVISQYAQGLPEDTRLEWQRIEGRFKSLSLSGDAHISYKLLMEGLKHLNLSMTSKLSEKGAEGLKDVIGKALEMNILDVPPEDAANIYQKLYPLHPMTVYCLPALSEKVAQNERTLFTFLFGGDSFSLSHLLADLEDFKCSSPFIYVDGLYDYFADAMKVDTGPGGTHEIWSYAEGALKRLPDTQHLAKRIVKALAIIHAVRKTYSNRPDSKLLAFSLGLPDKSEQFRKALEYLNESKLVIYRTSSGCWEFFNRSEIDINHEIDQVLREHKPHKQTLISFLERNFKKNYYPARRYIDEVGTIRYFIGIYRTLEDLLKVNDWEALLKEQDYTDGLVVFILVTNPSEMTKAEQYVLSRQEERVIFVLPQYPLQIFKELETMFALSLLQSKVSLKEQDHRIEKELEFLIDDAREKVSQLLKNFIDPVSEGRWFYNGDQLPVKSFSGVCRYISEICSKVFHETPEIYNEALNRKNPSMQQVKASQKVIDGLLQNCSYPHLGLTGNGPDVAIYKAILKRHGFIENAENRAQIVKPTDPKLLSIWDKIESYIINAKDWVSFATLIDELQSPPLGLREGVIPIFLALLFSKYLSNIDLRFRDRIVSPIRSRHITELVKNPELYMLNYRDISQFGDLNNALWEEFCEEESYNKQTPQTISQCMNDWLLELPNYSRQTKRYLSEQAIKFRDIIEMSKDDPYRELMINLPTVLNIKESTCQEDIKSKIRDIKEELGNATGYLEKHLITKFKDMFGVGLEGLSSCANKWLSSMQVKKGINLDTFSVGDDYGDILLKYCRNQELDEARWLQGITKEITGLDLDYWTDITEKEFIRIINDAMDRVKRELVDDLGEDDLDLVELSFGHLINTQPNGNKQNKEKITFKQGKMSPQAKNLLYSIKKTIKTTGKNLTKDERMEIGYEILKDLLESKKG